MTLDKNLNKTILHFLTLKQQPITPEWLKRHGFEEREPYSWKGNGYDYQPDFPNTTLKDFVFYITDEGRKGDVIIYRWNEWRYGSENDVKLDVTTQILFPTNYYEKNFEEGLPGRKVIQTTVELQMITYLLTGVILKPVKNEKVIDSLPYF